MISTLFARGVSRSLLKCTPTFAMNHIKDMNE